MYKMFSLDSPLKRSGGSGARLLSLKIRLCRLAKPPNTAGGSGARLLLLKIRLCRLARPPNTAGGKRRSPREVRFKEVNPDSPSKS